MNDSLLCAREYMRTEMGMSIDETLTAEQLALADVINDSGVGVVDLSDGLSILRYYVYAMVIDDSVPSEEFFANESAYMEAFDQPELVDAGNKVVNDAQTDF